MKALRFLPLLLLIGGGLLFSVSPQVHNALSGVASGDFIVRVPVLRILLEPWLGYFLFILRGEQTLKVMVMFLLWAALILVLVRLLPVFRKREKNAHGARGWFSILSRVAGEGVILGTLWMALLWIMILWPLPSNQLERKEAGWVVVNTHCHTDRSKDGLQSLRRMQAWHHYNGFDAWFITEHDEHGAALETVRRQDSGNFPPAPLVLAGEEYSGSNHMTLLGIREAFESSSMAQAEVITRTHKQGGVVVVAHWFEEENESLRFFAGLGVDGFEIVNQAVGTYPDSIRKMITGLCRRDSLLMIGAVDNHGYGMPCGTWTALHIPGWHELEVPQRREAIMQVLRDRDMGRVKVLEYYDRNSRGRVPLILRPPVDLFNYFRTLNVWQVLSWLIWTLPFFLLRSLRSGIQRMRFRLYVAGAAALYLIVQGILFLVQAQAFGFQDRVISRYGLLLLVFGGLSLIFLVIMGLRPRLKAIRLRS